MKNEKTKKVLATRSYGEIKKKVAIKKRDKIKKFTKHCNYSNILIDSFH